MPLADRQESRRTGDACVASARCRQDPAHLEGLAEPLVELAVHHRRQHRSCCLTSIFNQFSARVLQRPASTLASLPATEDLAITDEASPFALRSTRNRLRTVVHRRCQWLVVEAAGMMAPTLLPKTAMQGPCQRFARNCATRNLAWPHDAALNDASYLRVCGGTCVAAGFVNHPRIDGMQGVRGSNPLSSTPGQRPSPPSTARESRRSRSRDAATASARPRRSSSAAVTRPTIIGVASR
jgi:hypothetical protein